MGSLFRPCDLVVVTSREERGGSLPNVQFAAAINPWTDDEANDYIRNYFRQPRVRAAVQGGPTAVAAREGKAISAIKDKRFGSFSTLPIVLEMLCWLKEEGDGDGGELTSITDLYTKTVMKKIHLSRASVAGWSSTDDQLLAFFTAKSLKATRDGVFFSIDCDSAVGGDALRSGLLRERDGALTVQTEVRFVHKSFLEYFQALNFSAELTRLSTALENHHLVQQPHPHKDGTSFEFVMHSAPDDVVRIVSHAEQQVMVHLQLECVRSVGAPIDVVWLAGKQEKAAYDGGHYKSLCKWDHENQPLIHIPPLQLHPEAQYFFVLRPSRGTHIVPVRCRYISSGNHTSTQLEVTQEFPLCDIPGHRQQRNFFQILADLVKTDPTRRDQLLQHLFRRLAYHHVRTASWVPNEGRSLASPLGHSSGAGFASGGSGRSSKARTLAEMGLFTVVECAAALLPSHSQFVKLLDSIPERSSRFGRLTESLGLRWKYIFEWRCCPARPTAAYQCGRASSLASLRNEKRKCASTGASWRKRWLRR